jgi:ribulose-phosphate 3-epimerase
MIKIYPSLIASDILNLESEIKKLEPYCDGFHLDIMDYHFVPNLTFGPLIINQISKITDKQLWIHLMVTNPKVYLDSLLLKKNDIFSFHFESKQEIVTLISEIEKRELQSSLVINPETDIDMIKPYLFTVNQITIMSVHPGFSGQRFLDATYDKLNNLNIIKQKQNLKFNIGIDGGVNKDNISKLSDIGGTEFVIGSALFKEENQIQYLKDIKKILR